MLRLLAFFLLLTASLKANSFLIDSPHSGHKIEIFVANPKEQNNKLLLFLHGSSGQGLKGISHSWFDHWLNKGYRIAAVSMPGYGESTGKKDFCGPFTIETLHFAIDTIKKELCCSSLGMIGFGQGALASLLLASQREDICCLVAANGGYDLLRHRDDKLIQTIKEKEYALDLADRASLVYRSPIEHISSINTPLFLLHRKDNPVIQESEVLDFHQAMLKAGKECCIVIKDKTPQDDPQKLSDKEVLAETEAWVDHHMAS